MNLSDIRCLLARSPELMQSRLLTAQGIQTFARERGIFLSGAETVLALWRAGLVRSDSLVAARDDDVPEGLELLSEGEDGQEWFDARPVPIRPNGYGGVFAEFPELPNLEPLFHPFRLYVLHHVHRVFRSSASATQYLQKPDGLINIAKIEVQQLDRWTATDKCAERFEHWNQCCELPTVLEPFVHGRIFGSVRLPVDIDEVEYDRRLAEYREAASGYLRGSELSWIETVRKDLCISAEQIDGNKLLHVLLRLAAEEQRARLKGDIGASMHILAMAETIRRAAEAALGRELCEEDGLGFGQWMDGARKVIYGTTRILDAPKEVRRDFMTSMGLDHGPKVRCYVEGDTELAALVACNS